TPMSMTLLGLDHSAVLSISGRPGACMKRTRWRVPMTCGSVGHACVSRSDTATWRHRHDTGITFCGSRCPAECKSPVRAHAARSCANAGGQAVCRDGAMVCLGCGQTAGLAVHAEGAAGRGPVVVLLA